MTGRALLFSDLVDCTLLVERFGDARAAEVWAEQDRRVREPLRSRVRSSTARRSASVTK